MENINLVIDNFKERITQVDGVLRKRYQVILNCLLDEDYFKLVPQGILNILNQLIAQFQSGTKLEGIEAGNPSLDKDLNDLFFYCLIYLNDKKKNVSHFEARTKELEERINAAQENINHIDEKAKLITDATVLTAYAETFDKEAADHLEAAGLWLNRLIVSIFVLAILVWLVLFFNIAEMPYLKEHLATDISKQTYFDIIIVVIKTSLIVAYLQIPLFLKRNYFAEKHLEEACKHRRNVLKSLHAVYNTITNQEEKDRIVTVGASIAFSEAESGFITRKEGAGSDDNVFTNLLSKIIK